MSTIGSQTPAIVTAALIVLRRTGPQIGLLVARQAAEAERVDRHVEIERVLPLDPLRGIDRSNLRVDADPPQRVGERQRHALEVRVVEHDLEMHLVAGRIDKFSVFNRPARVSQQIERLFQAGAIVARTHRSPAS